MTTISDLVAAVGQFAWPAVVSVALFVYRKDIAAVFESLRTRGMSLEAGGMKLTLAEAHEQDARLLADLQKKLLEVERRAPGAAKALAARPRQGRGHATPPRTVLWVDDHPRNNAVLVGQLEQMDVRVDTALSTSEALRRARRTRYDAVISDMGRLEDRKYHADAGLDLLRALKKEDPDLPVVFFTTRRAVQEKADAVGKAGGTAVTSSSYELLQALGL